MKENKLTLTLVDCDIDIKLEMKKLFSSHDYDN